MWRRALFIFSLSLIFMVSLSACSKKDNAEVAKSPEVDTPTTKPAPPTEVTETPVEKPPVETQMMKMPVLEDVFFAFDSSALSAEAKQKLESDAKQLKDAVLPRK